MGGYHRGRAVDISRLTRGPALTPGAVRMLHTCQSRDPLNPAVELISPPVERFDRLYGNLATRPLFIVARLRQQKKGPWPVMPDERPYTEAPPD